MMKNRFAHSFYNRVEGEVNSCQLEFTCRNSVTVFDECCLQGTFLIISDLLKLCNHLFRCIIWIAVCCFRCPSKMWDS